MSSFICSKSVPPINISLNEHKIVFSKGDLTFTGVDTTAKSILPLFTASIACGVEWLYIFSLTFGYILWKDFRISNKNIFKAVSLAPIEILPWKIPSSSASSSSASKSCAIAIDTCSYKRFPSCVSCTPLFVLTNKVLLICCSKQFIALVTLGWLLPNAWAALVKFSYLAT